MVRNRNHDVDEKQQSGRPRFPKQDSRDSTSPRPTAENMQYVSNSRSNTRLLQSAPAPGLIRWLFRLRITRFLLVLTLTAVVGFMFWGLFHWGLPAGPDGSFDMQGDLRLHHKENHPNTFHQKGIDKAAQHHQANSGLRDNQHHQEDPKGGAQHHQDVAQQQPDGPMMQPEQPMSDWERRAQESYDEHRRQAKLLKERVREQMAQQNAHAQHAVQQPIPQPIAKQPHDPIASDQHVAPNLHAGQQPANDILKAKKPQVQDAPSDVNTYPNHIIQSLTNTHKMPLLKTRFIECTKSILEKASINLHFFFVVDEESQKFIMDVLQYITDEHIAKSKFQVKIRLGNLE